MNRHDRDPIHAHEGSGNALDAAIARNDVESAARLIVLAAVRALRVMPAADIEDLLAELDGPTEEDGDVPIAF
jgi:hypothetical protein